MRKELKYFFYVFTILGFIIFVSNYYFSDKNKKNSYRIINSYDDNVIKYNKNLLKLESDTDAIVEYVENSLNNKKNNYKFWELFLDD